MFLCEVDGNYILFEPLKSREENDMIRDYNILIERLHKKVIRPKTDGGDQGTQRSLSDSLQRTWNRMGTGPSRKP